ncbi:hypothetical protein [Citricoccus muralis]|uniref:Uncharacterized protein n=1 Tax=Citricoccus muralis TaxID=169134 RepID=A0ABY8H863_9MICC|nr:hypothetical protein [Citricoccus muralis]WFP17344.1 hypothetical protein P8192_04325 [Citricoccus muralis]
MSNEFPQPPQQDPQSQYGGQQPGNKYNTAAYQPAGQYGAPLQRPKALATLRNLTIISAVLYVISSIIGVIAGMDEELIAQQLRDAGGLTEAQIEEFLDASMMIGVITVIGISVVGLIMYTVVIIGVSLAKNWGRILGIVFAIIGLLYTVFGVISGGLDYAVSSPLMIASTVVSVIWMLVSILWLVKAFSAPVREYFATPPQARA